VELSDDYSILELRATHNLIGKNLKQLDLRKKFKCNVLAIKTGDTMNISPYPDDQIMEDDTLVIIGQNDDLAELEIALAD
jgi:trk system potassium uptake protein TrkA